MLHMHIFLKMSNFQLVRQRQHVDAVGCGTFFGGLICMFFADILRAPSGCNQIGSGCIACTGISPDTGLLDRDIVKP
jgi:hypothetical protein